VRGASALIRLAAYEVEVLQNRLAEISDRRMAREMMLASLDAEAEAETAHAKRDAEAGWYMAGYRQGWQIRRTAAVGALNDCEMEEAGARDALAAAFETLKKYEHAAELAAKAAAKVEARKETAMLDELALRRRR
jgi:flagellar FliJ protein